MEPERLALDAALTRRGQLVEMRVMESNPLGACRDAAVRAGIERHLAWLDEEVAAADRALAEAVESSPAWRERDELLRSIPGIGPTVSRTLLAALSEPGTTGGGRLAALAGLAPYADDSGARKGARHVRGGRADVRRMLTWRPWRPRAAPGLYGISPSGCGRAASGRRWSWSPSRGSSWSSPTPWSAPAAGGSRSWPRPAERGDRTARSPFES